MLYLVEVIHECKYLFILTLQFKFLYEPTTIMNLIIKAETLQLRSSTR